MAKEKISNITKPKPLKDTFLDTFKTFKDNKELFFLVPPIIGGSIQLFYLLSIDFKFIRFFSVSQLLADGLAFFIFIAFIFISYKVLYLLFNHIIYSLLHRKYGEILYEWLINLLLLSLIPIKYFNVIHNDSFIYGSFIIIVLFILIINLNLAIKYNLTKLKKFTKIILGISISILSFFIVFGISHYIKKLNSPFFLNYVNLMTVVDEIYPDKTDSKILYYNDQYIFVEITTNNINKEEKKDIHLFKQSTFFDNSRLELLNEVYKRGINIFEKKDSIYNSKIDSLNLVIKKLKNK